MRSFSETEVSIVSGLPRSGTSMMMRILEVGGIPPLIDNLRVSNEDNPGGYYEFEPVKQTKVDPSWLTVAPGKVVKMVYRLLYDLPKNHNYRVLIMRRDVREVLASQRKMLQRDGREDTIQDADMAALFGSELRRFDKWIAAQPNFEFINVDYGDVLQKTAEVVSQINEFFGGGLNEASMIDVINPSLYRNRIG